MRVDGLDLSDKLLGKGKREKVSGSLLAKICFEMEVAVHNMSANAWYGERGLLHRNARYFKQRSRFDIGISFRGPELVVDCHVFSQTAL